jgi:hypothetical protein
LDDPLEAETLLVLRTTARLFLLIVDRFFVAGMMVFTIPLLKVS